jgi:menaquinone-dependent protoporphyrinogen oxidase
MSKVLVVYATKSGCTAGIAEQVGKTLTEKGVEATVIAAEDAGDPSGYDAVVLGSGVRAGTWHEAARTWASDNAEQLKAMPTALFTCGLVITGGAEKSDEVRAYTDSVIAQTGITPVDVGLFAGWNEPKQFSFLERSIMKLMKAPQGDFRDLSAIGDWTESTAERLGVVG